MDEEAQTIDQPKKMYWEGQKNTAMDDKDDDDQDKLVFVVLLVPIDWKFTQQMMEFSMEMDSDEHGLDSLIGGRKRL